MTALCQRATAEAVQAMAFGDLFLTDIRAYREKQLAGTGLEPIFPVWQIPTASLARTMIASGLRAKITCVDPRVLPAEFAGRDFDSQFLADLPPQIDPCGENGEFHSFVYDAPGFRHPIPVTVGEMTRARRFHLRRSHVTGYRAINPRLISLSRGTSRSCPSIQRPFHRGYDTPRRTSSALPPFCEVPLYSSKGPCLA